MTTTEHTYGDVPASDAGAGGLTTIPVVQFNPHVGSTICASRHGDDACVLLENHKGAHWSRRIFWGDREQDA